MGGTVAEVRPKQALGRHSRRSGSAWPWWVTTYWPLAWGAAVGAAVFVLTRRAMPDDALITLAFARNLVDHGCWCITTGLEVNTATSPLTVWLYALLYAVSGQAFVAAGLLLVTCYAACAWWLRCLGGSGACLLGVMLLAGSPILIASVGMETLLAVTVLLGAVTAAVSRRWPAVALAMAAAPLTRPDLAAGVVGAVLLVAVLDGMWRRAVAALVAGLAATSPWYAFSWWHFGSVWPDTLPVKSGQGGWGADGSIHLVNSLPLLMSQSPTAIWIAVFVLVGGVVAAALSLDRGNSVPVALAVGGCLEFAALASTATTPIIYYPGVLVGAMSLTLALGAAAVRWLLFWPILAIVAGFTFTVHHADNILGGFVPLRQNWATNAEYERIVAELPTDAPVYSPGEIGAFAFYCLDRRPACTVVDPFLADPGRVDEYVTRWRREHPGAEVNYARRTTHEPVATRWQVTFTYPGRPERPGDIATTGGLWKPGFARLERSQP